MIKWIQTSILSLLLLGTGFAQAETTIYYHTDALGSPVAATDEQGNILWRENYAPYGDRLLKQDGGTENTWYTGKQHDEGIGLSYFGARWYDPVHGRFMAMDPVGFQEDNIHSFNKYAYANNNPYKYVDPDGNIGLLAILMWAPEIGDGLAASAVFLQGTATNDRHMMSTGAEGLAVLATGIVKSGGSKGKAVSGTFKIVTKGAKPLLGKNPRVTKSRTNTDLPGGKATAKSIFRNQTKGQKIDQQPQKNGGVRRIAEDGTQIRINPDGSTRLDLPNRGPNPPGRETIHIDL